MDNDKIIYRYPIALSSEKLRGNETTIVTVPKGAFLLTVKWHKGSLNVWFVVDTEIEETEDVEFLVLGTGFARFSQETMERISFVGTAINKAIEEVYHVFTVNPEIAIYPVANTAGAAAWENYLSNRRA